MAFIDEIKEILPNGKDSVTDAQLEGSKIVVYVKDLDHFTDNPRLVRALVDHYKKRVDLRADPSTLVSADSAKKSIMELVPKEAEITEVTFLNNVSRVIIEAKKPGLVIGKNGATLREIKKKIKWSPRVERTPIIPSQVVQTIRHVLYSSMDERKTFLTSLGRKVKPSAMAEAMTNQDSWVRLTTLGAGREIGRSALLLQTSDSNILMDCGVNVAAEGARAYPYFNAPEFNINSLDAVVISHAHLDHSGLVPYLYKYGYKGPTYCTPATRDLMVMLQLDFVDIAQREAKKVPYTKKDIQTTIKHTIAVDYGEVTDIASDARMTLYNAGHILGSSQVHLHIGDGLHNLVYTGDMQYDRTRLFDPADTNFMRLETLIIESTYGRREDVAPNRQVAEKRFVDLIDETLNNGGKVLCPVLAVGRAQEIMIVLEQWARENKREDFHIYLDGMIWDATAIHTAYPEYLSRNLMQSIFHEDNNPFLSPVFKRIGSQKERQELIESESPAVILATSGMMSGGPSVEYFRHLAGGKKNTLLFVSYQGEGTLGRKIQKGLNPVTVENRQGQQENIPVNLRVEVIDGFSGHSDRKHLMNFVHHLKPRPSKVLVVHGDQVKSTDLASSLHNTMRIETYAPKNLETIRLR